MSRRVKRIFAAFRADARGNIVTIAALALPVMMLAIAAAVNFSEAVALQAKTQAAADSAALAATTAYANGTVTTPQDAETVANNFFAANAPAQAVSGETAFNVVTTTSQTVSHKGGPSDQGAVTTAVNYSYGGGMNSLISGLLGLGLTFDVASTAQATVSISSPGQGNVTGGSQVWGDPHVVSPEYQTTYFDCPTGPWYNLISDYQVQVNVSCADWHPGYAGYQFVNQYALTLGGHQILVYSGVTYCDFSWTNCYYPPDAWAGQVTIDGVVYPAPSVSGSYVLLSDDAQNITVTDEIGAPGVASSASNALWITTHNYNFYIDFDDFNTGQIAVQAVDAGSCGTPGGFLGQTYGNETNWTPSFFQEPSKWSLDADYSQKCEALTQLTTAHITK